MGLHFTTLSLRDASQDEVVRWVKQAFEAFEGAAAPASRGWATLVEATEFGHGGRLVADGAALCAKAERKGLGISAVSSLNEISLVAFDAHGLVVHERKFDWGSFGERDEDLPFLHVLGKFFKLPELDQEPSTLKVAELGYDERIWFLLDELQTEHAATTFVELVVHEDEPSFSKFVRIGKQA